MIHFDTSLEENKIFLESGNTFSKALFLLNYAKNHKILLILDNDKILGDYEKIFKEFHEFPIKIDSYSTISSYLYARDGIYLVNKDIFNIKENFYYFDKEKSLCIAKNDSLDLDELMKKFSDFGYKNADYIAENTYNRKGDSVSFMPNFGSKKYQLSLWGDIVEGISEVDVITGELNEVDSIGFGDGKSLDFEDKFNFNESLLELLWKSQSVAVFDSLDFYRDIDKLKFDRFIKFNMFAGGLSGYSELNLGVKDFSLNGIDELKKVLENAGKSDQKVLKNGQKVVKNIEIFTKNHQILDDFLEINGIFGIKINKTSLNLLKSFEISNSRENKIVICDDILSKIFVKKRVKKSLSSQIDLLISIKAGDFIVHIDHGIGVFNGSVKKNLAGIEREYIELEYLGGDKLFVPVTEVNRVTKYIGGENPKLTGLSTNKWQKAMKEASEDAEAVAEELLEIYSQRKLAKGYKFLSLPKEEGEFKASFSYDYTDDQANAVGEIFEDMESEKAMDRLLSGDVGFGKTEVAFNAIFKAFLNKKQAVLISPLVVLAYEHYEKAIERFSDFGLRVEVITRLEKPSKVKDVLKKLKAGTIDLVIGTHRLLSDDVEFKNLGLLVIDEEHKFGVKDKEKIKKLRSNVDILSMSATPIPRSLNMALSGVKDMSILATPPFGRKSIMTTVSRMSDSIILDAGRREFERGGQMFFVHNRVQGIERMKEYLEELFVDKRVVIVHGQLDGFELEDRILAFKRKEFDILLTTTVVENGVDFTNANTILINDAHRFGLSQIHQLRGRVGRNKLQGYCYLLYSRDKIAEDGAKRLKTLAEYTHLGAGFEIAMRDLEIRGGGDILGISQSGHTKNIGVSTFIELLERKVQEKRKEKEGIEEEIVKIDTNVDLNISAFIEDKHFSSELDKMNFYREVENVVSLGEFEDLVAGFKEFNEEFSSSTENFFDLLKLKILAYNRKISSIKRVGVNYQIDFFSSSTLEDVRAFLELDKEVKYVVATPHKLRSSVKNFASDDGYLRFMIDFFENKKNSRPKIKVKKKFG